MSSERVTLVEVGARDGLQNEPGTIAADAKVELIERLAATGITAIEVTSFVRPDRIPQLADADEVARRVQLPHGTRAIALAPNVAGLERAVGTVINEVAVFAAASDAFNERNVGRPTAEALAMFRPVTERARQLGFRVRGYVSTVLGCPYQGDVDPDHVVAVAESLLEMGCDELSLGDTIGVGTPSRTRALVRRIGATVSLERVAVHMHDTYGMGLANSLAAIEEGIRIVDASVGGLGGCPFAGPGARGNVATEDVVYALAGSDYETGIDLDALVDTAWWLGESLGHAPVSRVATAIRARGSTDA